MLAAAFLPALQGCDAITGSEDTREVERRLIAAKALWNSQAAQSYQYTGALLCFCGFGGADVNVTVTNDSVTRVVYQDTLVITAPAVTAFQTVDDLFERLEDAINRGVYSIEAEFDAQRGYPKSFFIDYSVNAADEEFGYRITQLTPAFNQQEVR